MIPRSKLPPHIARVARFTPLALVALAATGAGACSASTDAQTPASASGQVVEIVVDGGYSPSRVEVSAADPVRLAFLRRDESECTREVVFPTLGLRRELPTQERVVIELGQLAAGEYEFACGMNMVRGTLVVRSRS